MNKLFSNIKFYVLLLTFIISIIIYVYVIGTVSIPTGQAVKFTQLYAFLAVIYLYLAIMVTPITKYFKSLPFNKIYIEIRKELIISAFYFGLLHGYFAFFGELGGFPGLFFLSPLFLLSICLSAAALLLLTIIVVISINKFIDGKWKMIHQFIYLVALLVIIHSLMLGTHFINLSAMIPKIFFSALAVLIILETKRFDDYISQKYKNFPTFGIFGVLGVVGIIYFLVTYVFTSSVNNVSLGIHAQHVLDAKNSQNVKLSVSISPIGNISSGKKTNLQFAVFNTVSGDRIKDFSVNQEKLMHLIIVSDDLTIFDHIHPALKDGIFSVDYIFPKDGFYRLYTDFQPVGLSEQVFPFKVGVGSGSDKTVSITKDFKTETEVDGIKAKLILPKNINAKDLSSGKDLLTFDFSDSKTGADITNIGTYLGAFGHLIMINTDSYNYVHVHPNLNYTPVIGEETGPKVSFSPLGIYGTIYPGTYKLFGQFNIGGKIKVFTFFIKVN